MIQPTRNGPMDVPVKKQPRVFCIGMNKTGTSTLKHCFEILRLTPIASPKTYSPEQRKRIKHFYNHKNYADMLDLAAGFQSFEDRPWNMWSMYRRLHERFPDSRFILTTRRPESWWRSTEQWITVTKPQVISRYQLHLRTAQVSKESMIDSYLRYNDEVTSYFADSEQLLVMDLERGDGWDKLCHFLGLPIPLEEFPHANRQTYTPEDAKALAAKRRLKHGVECQNCQNLTLIKRTAHHHVKRTSAGHKERVKGRLSSKAYMRLKRVFPNYLENSVTAQQVLYGTHSFLRGLNSSSPGAGKREASRSNPVAAEQQLAVVSCLFNPGGSRRRAHNFLAFLDGIKSSGVRCLVVELAFGSNPFEITDHEDIIQLRTDSVLWHKERLLNIGIQRLLSEGVEQIAWLDGDIAFKDRHWPTEISNRLRHARLCQVFGTIAVRENPDGPPLVAPSAIKYFRENGQFFTQPPSKIRNLVRGMLKGGQSGFGWAARADVLRKVPLFEHAIVGGADKLMLAASLAQDIGDSRVKDLTRSSIQCKACGHRNQSSRYTSDYLQWAQQWSAAVNGEVDYARLHIEDMYHGKRSDRGYMSRHDILYRHQYDPATDLADQAGCCLEWSSGKEQLRKEVEAYFLSRREDV